MKETYETPRLEVIQFEADEIWTGVEWGNPSGVE